MKAASLLLASSLTAAGCATLTPANCASTDWYQLGLRDGSASGISSLEQYKQQCGAAGSQPDEERYAKGWALGKWDKDHRRF